MIQKIKAFIGVLLMRGMLLWDNVSGRGDGYSMIRSYLFMYFKKRYSFMSDSELEELVELNLHTVLAGLKSKG